MRSSWLSPPVTSTAFPRSRAIRTSFEDDAVVKPDGRDLGRVVAKQQRVGGEGHCVWIRRNPKMDARERAWRKRAVLVVGEELDQQRSRFLVDRVRGRIDRGVERAIGILGQLESRLHAVLHDSRVGLRHRNVDPHLMNVGDCKQGDAIVRSPP